MLISIVKRAEFLDSLVLHFLHIGVPVGVDALFPGEEGVVPDLEGMVLDTTLIV